MKKLFALMMVLALCLCSFAALAEAPMELNWSDFESVAESVPGSFYTFNDVALQMWIPDDFEQQEISEEEVAQGFLVYLTTAAGHSMVVQLVDVNGMSIEDYAAAAAQVDGVSGVEIGTVNGLPCVSYDVKANDVGCVSFTTQSGKVLEFSFSPVSDENYTSIFGAMIASIQPEQ